MLELLNSACSVNCDHSCRELLGYLSGPRYDEDTVGAEEVFNSELILLHEAAEACTP